MLPPPESTLHEIHKIAEPHTGPEHPDTVTPPPPYSPPHPNHSPPKESDGVNAPQWMTPHPITINIDASVSVLGNANSILIPSVPATTAAAAAATTSSSSPPPPPPAPSSSTAILQSAQRHRQSKLTDMATSIIVALHRTGLLNPTDNSGSVPSVRLNINTGIKIQGTRNVVCVGGGVVGRRNLIEPGGERGEERVGQVGRKRRAESEPFESCTGKKTRSSLSGEK
ncbi:uncharacterized protein BO80DRAFT_78756 [Aspergillus ibericus CBS 121593]|uniref:Uncharacterized protein n=1 Tax=Aspergillus ibericus CBS 121593 TaxID=1448316 RepID=A0A395HD00_9EURO|nr:hypothetical protein BO80DRAFT_78756 [Aspergillus ibericus CBS 121593]RAL05702.1 hypothetical protein BO80DRAFT_78756 [Aspergillus ibericus CBS 121593]